MAKTRAEHLEWCKQRAHACLPGAPRAAFASMMSDLRKHDELWWHSQIAVGRKHARRRAWLDNALDVQGFIDGFN